MARATHIRNPAVYHVSSTLLGRTKLQAVSTSQPLRRPSLPRPARVPRPKRPPFAGL
jgi:hypothetical protein